MKKLFYLIISSFLLLTAQPILAQVPAGENLASFFQLEDLLQQSNNESLVTSADYLRKLTYDLVPSIYLNQSNLKVDDEFGSPIRIVTDVKSIEKLYESNSLYDNVQIIIIQINKKDELTKFLRANSLNHFSNLKYVYISCSFELCDESDGKKACEKNNILSILDGELTPSITLVYTANQSE